MSARVRRVGVVLTQGMRGALRLFFIVSPLLKTNLVQNNDFESIECSVMEAIIFIFLCGSCAPSPSCAE